MLICYSQLFHALCFFRSILTVFGLGLMGNKRIRAYRLGGQPICLLFYADAFLFADRFLLNADQAGGFWSSGFYLIYMLVGYLAYSYVCNAMRSFYRRSNGYIDTISVWEANAWQTTASWEIRYQIVYICMVVVLAD